MLCGVGWFGGGVCGVVWGVMGVDASCRGNISFIYLFYVMDTLCFVNEVQQLAPAVS